MTKILNKTKDTILAQDVMLADTPFKRIRGLLGRKEFKKEQALVLRPSNSIHTFFMRFAIDVIFIDKENKIIAIKICLRPWRLSRIYWQAQSVIELPLGVIIDSNTCVGDEISFV